MTMLIVKFHKLIQNKILWLIFLAMIVISFVVWGSYTPGQNRRSREAASPGKLFGEYVSPKTFRRHYSSAYLAIALTTGQAIDRNKYDYLIREAAWDQMVSLQKAKDLNLQASNAEIVNAIQSERAFQTETGFNKNIYAAFVANFLRPMGVSELLFEQHIHDQILVEKLAQIISQGVFVSPTEISRRYHALSDSFTFEYAFLEAGLVKDDVELTEKKARAYFDTSKEKFKLPEQVRVRYVRFPVDDFLDQLEAGPTEEEALVYYQENLSRYIVEEEVSVPESDESETDEKETLDLLAPSTQWVSTTNAFEDVKESILDKLRFDQARELAADQATELVVDLTPSHGGAAPPFAEVATTYGREIHKLKPFSEGDFVPGVDAGADFSRAAFELELNPVRYFSDAVLGEKSVYVIELVERLDPRIPMFEEVQDRVMDLALINLTAETLEDKAQSIRSEALEAMNQGGTFAATLEKHGIEIQREEDLALASGYEKFPEAGIIFRGLLISNPGEITELLPANNKLILAFLEKRKVADDLLMVDMRRDIIRALKQNQSQLLFKEYKNTLLKQADFQPRILADDSEDDS